MPDTQSSQQPDTGGIDAGTAALIAAALQAGQSKKQPAGPIGVPYYITDPQTGQPQMYDPATGREVTTDNNGKPVYADTGDQFTGTSQPLRWGAQVNGPTDPNAGRSGAEARFATSQASQYVLPRYFDGAQWLPGQLPPEQMVALQNRMIQAGLLKKGQAHVGVWDPASVEAYSALLAFANSSGTDWTTALDRWQGSAADNPEVRQPLVKKVTAIEDLRPAIRKAFIDTLGQGISQDQIDLLATQFQQIEGSAQEQQYAMTGSGSSTDPGPGGTVIAPPDPTSFAVSKAREQNPELAQEHDALGYIDAFSQMVGKWQGTH